MRAAVLALMIGMALSGCGDRRSFDERYDDTSQAMANEARDLDANLADDNLADPATNAAPR